MRGRDQRLEVFGPAVARIRRKGQHAVIAPIPRAGEIGERHQLDRGDAEIPQPVELGHRRTIGSRARERAEMQLVNDGFAPRPAAPGFVAPFERVRRHELARAMDVLRLKARRGIGHGLLAVDDEVVKRAGMRVGRGELEPVAVARHLALAAVEAERDIAGLWGVEAKRCAAALRRRAERHAMQALHRSEAVSGPPSPSSISSARAGT